ncbi:hypothetical protein [Pararhodonellum marinum]|uniref:hypothetical protein n=1 Tax=Pararhodonellum marinum TaxID=2755358 RepID=UPI00188FCC58|nr:hypothetical protein [Pararhodonellum marinum]
MGKFNLILLNVFLVFSHLSFSQEIKVEGYFVEDSARLGERVSYILKATYPTQLDVLFPDSTYQYGDFAYLGKQTFTTYTQDSLTLDSAVYFLSNFSLDPIKSYALPVFEILRYDSIRHMAPEDQLELVLTIAEIPEQLQFKENNVYQPLKKAFNYPYLMIGLAVLAVLTFVIIYFLGNKLKSLWLAYLEKNRHNRFLKNWQQAVIEFEADPNLNKADELLGIWKSRMEHLTGEPYPEWTTTEIAEHLEKPTILDDLREIELIIYANRPSLKLHQACERLSGVCEEMYHQKIKSIHEYA